MNQRKKRQLACCALGICATVCTANAQAENVKSDCTGTIEGHVVDRQEHQAVAGVSIWINDNFATTTNTTGHFVANRQCAGKAKINVKSDYIDPSLTFALVRSGRVTSVEIEVKYHEDEHVDVHGEHSFQLDTRSSSDISGEELAQNRGKSLTDIVATKSGVTALGSGTNSAKPIIRGQFGRRLAILNDGIPHRAQSWGLDHAPEIESFSAGAIRVLRGAAGVRYGPQAVGGALLVEPPTLKGLKGLSGEAHVFHILGFGGGIQSRLQGSHPVLPSISGQVEGTFRKLAAGSTPDYALQNTGSEESSLGMSVAYHRPHQRHRLTIKRFNSQLGICACFNVESFSDFLNNLRLSEPGSVQHFESRFEIERSYQTVRHDQLTSHHRFELGNQGHAQLSYSLQRNLRQEFDTIRTAQGRGPQLVFDTLSHDFLTSFSHHPYHISEHLHLEGSVGINGLLQTLEFDGNPGRTLLPSYDNREVNFYAVERMLGHDFEVEAGLRLDIVNRIGKLSETELDRLSKDTDFDTSRCPAQANTFDCTFSFKLLSFTLGGVYQISAPWAIKANLSSTSRAPNPDEQFLNGRAPSFPVFGLGDPLLSPEKTTSTSLSSTFINERLDIEFSIFANHVRDYIYFAPKLKESGAPETETLIIGEIPLFTNTNIDASFVGADGSAWINLHSNLRIGTLLSMVRGQNLSANQPLSFVPPDRFRASLEYNSNGQHPMWIKSSLTRVQSQTSYDPQAELAPPPPGYTTMDLELGLETIIHHRATKITMQGQNIFNKRYRDYLSISRYFNDQPGMQWMLRISFFEN